MASKNSGIQLFLFFFAFGLLSLFITHNYFEKYISFGIGMTGFSIGYLMGLIIKNRYYTKPTKSNLYKYYIIILLLVLSYIIILNYFNLASNILFTIELIIMIIVFFSTYRMVKLAFRKRDFN
mgnify:CR=1 FL=1